MRPSICQGVEFGVQRVQLGIGGCPGLAARLEAAVRADGCGAHLAFRQREAARQVDQEAEHVVQMLLRQQVDGRQALQPRQARAAQELRLALVAVHAQPRLGVLRQVAPYVLVLEGGKAVHGALAEAGAAARLGVAQLGEDVVAGGLHVVQPVFFRRKPGFGGGEVCGQCAQISAEAGQTLHFRQRLKANPMRGHLRGFLVEVLQLARRVVGLQGFKERLGVVQLAAQFRAFLLREQGAAPERQTVAQVLPGANQLLHGFAYCRLHLLNRLVLALREQLRQAGGAAQQLEQGGQGRQVPLLGAFEVLEAGEVGEGNGGKLRQAHGVELAAGDGQHDVAGIDQRRQHHGHPFRLQAQGGLGHVLDARIVVDELRPVQHLAVAFTRHPLEDVFGVFGVLRG